MLIYSCLTNLREDTPSVAHSLFLDHAAALVEFIACPQVPLTALAENTGMVVNSPSDEGRGRMKARVNNESP
jgi:hypothetical protein